MHLNPNDGQGYGGQKKKAFTHLNQHYISSNAVLPGAASQYDLKEFLKKPNMP